VLIVGVLGLAVNIVAFLLLREGAKESLNVEGAYLEVMSDALGSLGVIVGAIVWGVTGWTWVDPVIGAAIGLFILPRAFRLGREAVRILVQAAPDRIDVPALRADLAGIPGVVDVHDLHVWTLTSDMEVASAHLMVRIGTDSHGVLDQARALLEQRHGLGHATLQIEPEDHRGCDEINW
jgi:cobalt-zinc-cadmium efflux system protein